MIGLPIDCAFMVFIAFKLFKGLFPIRAPGFGAKFGEFIPRCGLELPVFIFFFSIKRANLEKKSALNSFTQFAIYRLPCTRFPLRPIFGELTAKLGLELPIREPFGEFILPRCEFGVLFI